MASGMENSQILAILKSKCARVLQNYDTESVSSEVVVVIIREFEQSIHSGRVASCVSSPFGHGEA
jgi:hypothetical protein